MAIIEDPDSFITSDIIYSNFDDSYTDVLYVFLKKQGFSRKECQIFLTEIGFFFMVYWVDNEINKVNQEAEAIEALEKKGYLTRVIASNKKYKLTDKGKEVTELLKFFVEL